MGCKEHPEFIVDSMLGRLARWLRILGYDTWYFREIEDGELLRLQRESGRILLTRDTGLTKHRDAGPHILIRSNHWEDQLREVFQAFSMEIRLDSMLSRCIECNRVLVKLSLDKAWSRVPDYVAGAHSVFLECEGCRKVYWPGTHREHIRQVVSRLREGGRVTRG